MLYTNSYISYCLRFLLLPSFFFLSIFSSLFDGSQLLVIALWTEHGCTIQILVDSVALHCGNNSFIKEAKADYWNADGEQDEHRVWTNEGTDIVSFLCDISDKNETNCNVSGHDREDSHDYEHAG